MNRRLAMFDSIPYTRHYADQHDEHRVYLYGLSYCEHCEQGRQLLEEQGVAFDMTHLDTLAADVRRPVLKAFRDEYGEHVPYPVLEIDDEYLFGFNREVWLEKLGRE
ncbi:MAG: glutaredoxin family protein [Spirochaetaceae bacterium]|nr:MAG: glutaredoxin family protein [Spirochaetaceae bacterium]